MFIESKIKTKYTSVWLGVKTDLSGWIVNPRESNMVIVFQHSPRKLSDNPNKAELSRCAELSCPVQQHCERNF